MAKGVVVGFAGKSSSFGLAKVERAKLYGTKRRVVVDNDGNECATGYLTIDGAALLPPGSTAHLYLTEDFDTVERKDLVAADDQGKPLEPCPSTLGVEQELRGPVPPTRVLDLTVNSVYQLDPEELDPDLEARLERGEIFEFDFNYRQGYLRQTMLILKNEEGIFGLIGEETAFEFCRLDTVPSPEEEDEDPYGDMELDFGI